VESPGKVLLFFVIKSMVTLPEQSLTASFLSCCWVLIGVAPLSPDWLTSRPSDGLTDGLLLAWRHGAGREIVPSQWLEYTGEMTDHLLVCVEQRHSFTKFLKWLGIFVIISLAPVLPSWLYSASLYVCVCSYGVWSFLVYKMSKNYEQILMKVCGHVGCGLWSSRLDFDGDLDSFTGHGSLSTILCH